MDKLILFHGTSDKIVMPTYGKGEEKFDKAKWRGKIYLDMHL